MLSADHIFTFAFSLFPLVSVISRARFLSRLQVGLMFNGAGIVESMLPGGPAHASQKIDKGDRIVQVDGNEVVGSDLLTAITGSDVPGSVVDFTLEKRKVVFRGRVLCFWPWRLLAADCRVEI